nr:hypothetical protein [Dickeya dadantii]
MEEIGCRTTIFDYEGLGSARRDYVAWLLGACAAEGVKVSELLEEAAIDLIAERLRTPLQIEMHLTLAFEQAFRLGATRPRRDYRTGLVARYRRFRTAPDPQRLRCSGFDHTT